MVSVARIIPPPEIRREPVHYHIIMSGVLQLRFGQLCKLLTLLAWGLALILGTFSRIGWIWWLLPFRGVPLWLSAFAVLLLRKANLRTDALPYLSVISELTARGFSKVMLKTLITYNLASIMYFSLIKSQLPDMTVTLNHKNFEMPRLNERFLFVNSYMFYLGTAYAILHVVMDYDLLRFPTVPLTLSPRKRIEGRLPDAAILSVIFTTGVCFAFPIVYLIFRSQLWNVCLFFTRIIFNVSRSDDYVAFPLTFSLFVQLYLSTLFAVGLWQFVNCAFAVYMTLGPLHRRVAISEKSKDPNGTLVTGLKAVGRPLTRMMAFQELLYISVNDRDRRIAIFSDIDKTTGIWTQISKECMSVIDSTVDKFAEPAPIEPEPEPKKDIKSTSTASILHAKRDNIFAPPPKENRPGLAARSAQKFVVEKLQDKSASRSVEVIAFLNWAWSLILSFLMKYKVTLQIFLRLPIGSPFRLTLGRKVSSLIPNATLLACAVLSLTDMVCQSMDEDPYGTVQRNIPVVLDKLDHLIWLLAKFLDDPPYHWSDVYGGKRDSDVDFEKVYYILNTAVTGFDQVIVRFGDYVQEMPLSANVRTRAREVLARKEEASEQ